MAKLNAKIGANTKEYDRKIQHVKGSANDLGKQFKKLGGVIAGAFAIGQVTSFLKESTKLYNMQAQAENSLLVALKNRKDVQQRLISQAQEMQGRTLFGDEEIIQAQSLAASMGLAEDQISKMIPAAVDLSAATGMTLMGAVKNLARTYGGLSGELGEAIPKLRELTQEEMKAGEAIDLVNELMGGQAEAAAEVGTGSITQLSNAVGDLREELGELFTPREGTANALKGASESTAGFLEQVNRLRAANYGLVESLIAVGTGTAKVQIDLMDKFAKETKEGIDEEVKSAKDLIVIQKELLAEAEKMPGTTEKEIAARNRRIQVIEKEIARLKDLGKVKEIDVPDPIETFEGLSSEISSMGDGIDEGFITADMIFPETAVEKFDFRKNEILADMMEMEAQVRRLNEAFNANITDLATVFLEETGKLLTGTTDLSSAFNSILKQFGEFASRMGKLIVAYGISMEAFKKAFSNPFAAIAAGGALIVLGSAISSLASKGPTGSSTAVASSSSPTPASNSRNAPRQDTIKVEGVLRGKNIYLSNNRYNNDSLNLATTR